MAIELSPEILPSFLREQSEAQRYNLQRTQKGDLRDNRGREVMVGLRIGLTNLKFKMLLACSRQKSLGVAVGTCLEWLAECEVAQIVHARYVFLLSIRFH